MSICHGQGHVVTLLLGKKLLVGAPKWTGLQTWTLLSFPTNICLLRVLLTIFMRFLQQLISIHQNHVICKRTSGHHPTFNSIPSIAAVTAWQKKKKKKKKIKKIKKNSQAIYCTGACIRTIAVVLYLSRRDLLTDWVTVLHYTTSITGFTCSVFYKDIRVIILMWVHVWTSWVPTLQVYNCNNDLKCEMFVCHNIDILT